MRRIFRSPSQRQLSVEGKPRNYSCLTHANFGSSTTHLRGDLNSKINCRKSVHCFKKLPIRRLYAHVEKSILAASGICLCYTWQRLRKHPSKANNVSIWEKMTLALDVFIEFNKLLNWPRNTSMLMGLDGGLWK